jgi:hypothetical protein
MSRLPITLKAPCLLFYFFFTFRNVRFVACARGGEKEDNTKPIAPFLFFCCGTVLRKRESAHRLPLHDNMVTWRWRKLKADEQRRNKQKKGEMLTTQ